MSLLPSSTIKASLGIEPNGRVHYYFTQRCKAHMDKYIPMDTGALRSSAKTGTNYIDYDTPYAHYQWSGELYVMANGKGAYFNGEQYWSDKGISKTPSGKSLHYNVGGSHWDTRMWASDKEVVIREVQRYLNRYGGK